VYELGNTQDAAADTGVQKTLWVLEYTSPGFSSGSLHLFYAANEQEACTYVGEYLRRATARGKRLEFRRLKAFPHGFCTLYTEWRGIIHIHPDGPR
jgi:hypothetical protein